jgi:hypothetical protein
VFCAAYHEIDQLPHVSGSPSFRGHIRDLDTYYAAGCFVQYLIETYGTARFAELYHTGGYVHLYGRSLQELETDWIAAIEATDRSLPFSPQQLAYCVGEVAAAYDRLFVDFSGSDLEVSAYRELDRARIAVLEGRLEDTATHLATFDKLLERE